MRNSLFGSLPGKLGTGKGLSRTILLQELQCKRPQQTNSGSELSTLDMIFHFHAPQRELHPQKVAGRLQFFVQNW